MFDESDFDAPYIEDPGEPSAFTVFMNAYPKKENRDGALKEWWKIRPNLELEARIMKSVRLLKTTERWINGFAPDAKGFLRDRRWKDADGMIDPKDKPPIRIAEEGAPAPKEPQPLSTPQSAKAALREGVISGWMKLHPNEEVPAALLADPIGYVASKVKRI